MPACMAPVPIVNETVLGLNLDSGNPEKVPSPPATCLHWEFIFNHQKSCIALNNWSNNGSWSLTFLYFLYLAGSKFIFQGSDGPNKTNCFYCYRRKVFKALNFSTLVLNYRTRDERVASTAREELQRRIDRLYSKRLQWHFCSLCIFSPQNTDFFQKSYS